MTTGLMRANEMEHFQFSLTFHVRDYECDFQGIVNNAMYLHYVEHCRHEYAKHIGLDVVSLAKQGINLVVIRAELNYKHPLRSGDTFVVGTNLERVSRIRLAFQHTIYCPHQGASASNDGYDPEQDILIAQVRILVTAMNEHGRPFWPKSLDALFHQG
ncbi:hypothetical protein U14_01349 [Candidatus Moduliflexus flocculans]|uniref:Uncharacterized protein n=1 Tax=Candidatus Moduliflexus flocculans TaxID=1499966 RepID=A0A0S6VRY4_9BACT|nr:hypothetical protein U14_01349 [Candidatus Moduliflexus flocculans]